VHILPFANSACSPENAAVHLTLVVPCFNEEQRLPLDAFRRFAIEGARTEILFVDDGSTDRTRQLLEALVDEEPARFSLLPLDRNRGKAEAVRLGMLAAFDRNPDYAGFWDADLATPLTEITGFVEVFETSPEVELVFAARVRLLGRSISRNPGRHYFGRVGATLISSSLGLAIYDTQCGAKLFRVGPAIRELFADAFISRWIFDVEIIARLVRQRGRDAAARAIFELPIHVWHDVKGSKVRSTDFFRALGDLVKIRRAYRLGKKL
jgi:dolichyl-phosphate beta-glucosyltransferase